MNGADPQSGVVTAGAGASAAADHPCSGADARYLAFSAREVTYRYNGLFPALDGVTVDIGVGERVVLLGATGSGKSTFLKALDGLIEPESGSVTAFGAPISERALRDTAACARFRSRVGFVFQNPDTQLFCATVREDIAFGPLQLDLPREDVERRIEDAAQLLGIETLLDRVPFALSGGEKKKVAIAGVLAVAPEVLLLDEPTAGLDPRSQGWLIDLLLQLHRAGKTLVTATHDLGVASHVADRALVFDEAHRLVADGAAADILQETALLKRVNLIHEHLHSHGGVVHSHPHYHDFEHEHTHEDSEE